jgi:hypothetical protein
MPFASKVEDIWNTAIEIQDSLYSGRAPIHASLWKSSLLVVGDEDLQASQAQIHDGSAWFTIGFPGQELEMDHGDSYSCGR